jgi:hypothetical protein
MDLRRDEDHENMIEDIIRDGDDDVTLLFLKNSGEGDNKTEEMVPMREMSKTEEMAPMREKAMTPMREKLTAPVEP